MSSIYCEVGDVFPDVTLASEDNEPVRLRELCEDATLVVFFYPWNNSPGCVTQACAIRDNWPLLQNSNVNVVGVNSASVESHAKFSGKYGLPFPLLSDPRRDLAGEFDFVHLAPLLSGGSGRVERSTVIVDPGGTIRAILRKVKPGGHFDMLRVELGLGGAEA